MSTPTDDYMQRDHLADMRERRADARERFEQLTFSAMRNHLPICGEYPANRAELHDQVRANSGGKCIRCGHRDHFASGHVLTVHHFDGNKSNNEWWNLMALCQRCHLTIQGRVNPEIHYFLEHTAWAKPYVAGFYAKKYEGRLITREEAVARMEELLACERIA